MGRGYTYVPQPRTEPKADKTGEDGLEGTAVCVGITEKINIMELEIIDILDKNDLSHERVVLKVNEDCNCWPFIIFRNNGKRQDSRPYIFYNMDVEKGDFVTLYTKKGNDTKNNLPNGVKNHMLYWGLECSIWGAENAVALLVKTKEFDFKTL